MRVEHQAPETLINVQLDGFFIHSIFIGDRTLFHSLQLPTIILKWFCDCHVAVKPYSIKFYNQAITAVEKVYKRQIKDCQFSDQL